MSQCYTWLPVLIFIISITLKCLKLIMIVMIQFPSQTHTHKHIRTGRITNFLLCCSLHTPPLSPKLQPFQWYRELPLRGTAAEASNHSPLFSAQVKNGWIRTSSLPCDSITCTVTNWSDFLTLGVSKPTQISVWSLNYAAMNHKYCHLSQVKLYRRLNGGSIIDKNNSRNLI
jgi:hypothetical protein